MASNGYGQFFTSIATKTIIQTYWDDLKRQAANGNIDDKVVAIDMGKEMLLMILSQPGCEGIRIYHARGIEIIETGQTREYSIKDEGNNTLVAVGFDERGNELGVKLPKEVDITAARNVSLMAENVTIIDSEVMRSETNPPQTFGTITKNPIFNDPFGLAKAFNTFLTK